MSARFPARLPGKDVRRIVDRYIQYSSPHDIIRFGDRTTQTYDADGDPIPLPATPETISLHHQPLGSGKLIKDLPEGQRLEDVKKAWTKEDVQEKDRITIDGAIFTVNAIQIWPGQTGHKEMDLIRTGEQDNIA